VRPAYLELRQTGPDTYNVLWKVPAAGDDRRLAVYVQFPPQTKELGERHGLFSNNAYIERSRIQLDGGLDGQTIHIDGLSATTIDVLARVERADGTTQTTRLLPAAPGFVVETTPSRWSVSATYLRLGVEHILSGIDHLLYILAMLFLVKGWRRIVATMTAFTLTHSITLSAAALGYVHVPGPPVEAMIALSIVFVAREITLARRGKSGLTQQWPWVISFTFGLLHGFGFAGALSEVGLPAHAIPFALLSFNVGVEIGQLAFVAAVLGLFSIASRMPAPATSWAWRAAPYAIGSVAMFWVIQRVAAF
jgi:hydrogenase/urease accessory protein HupE